MPDINLTEWTDKGYRILRVHSADVEPRKLILKFSNSAITLTIKYSDVAEFNLFKVYPRDPLAVKGKNGNEDCDIKEFKDIAEMIDINNLRTIR
jgi:hypothetical protein